MLQNAYFLAKTIGADTADNEQHFAEILPKLATTLRVRRWAPRGRPLRCSSAQCACTPSRARPSGPAPLSSVLTIVSLRLPFFRERLISHLNLVQSKQRRNNWHSECVPWLSFSPCSSFGYWFQFNFEFWWFADLLIVVWREWPGHQVLIALTNSSFRIFQIVIASRVRNLKTSDSHQQKNINERCWDASTAAQSKCRASTEYV